MKQFVYHHSPKPQKELEAYRIISYLINHSVILYCVLKLCTVISTLRWAVLTVLWIGFCHTGPISLCV